jgi:hypothetical protein
MPPAAQRIAWVLAVLLALAAGAARAASPFDDLDLFSAGVFSGQAEVRIAGATGEESWTVGGAGKTRLSGGGKDFSGHGLADADLVWRPHLGWDLTGVFVGEAQSGERAGLGEAYLLYKPVPKSSLTWSARVGLFYPPISLEQDNAAWTVADTITPSAINSWVSEEVKVVAAEASVHKSFGEQSVGFTAAVFGYNDTSGTLLAIRGWSLDDIRANADSQFKLAPRSDFLEYVQAPYTNPIAEIDHRIGFYGRADWRINDQVAINVFFYDNNGDRTSHRADYQWAWADRFWNVGATIDLDEKTRVLAQAMTGGTQMGLAEPQRWVDVDYAAGYVLLTRKLGADAVTGRVDVFETTSHDYDDTGSLGESGWALTADYRRHLARHADLLVEALHVESRRPSLAEVDGQSPNQSQTVLQAALRLTF